MNTPSDILVFDRQARRRSLMRADLNQHGFLIDWAKDQLTERLQDIKREFSAPIDLKAHLDKEEELLDLEPEQQDLITSTLALHSINDLPGMLTQIRRSLKPDGLFVASMFGGETLHELRESLTQAELTLKGGASPRVFPFASKQQMGALLQRAGFALPVVDSEIVTVTYDHIFALMHDLRGMGESNIIRARDKRNPGKSLFLEAAQYYAERFSDPDGRIRATFEIIFLIGWAPHESQQKPCAPGSADINLKEVLR